MESLRCLTGAITLRDKPAAVWQSLQLSPAESRRHDDPDRRPSSSHCLREFDPIHRSRRVDVGEHNSDAVPAFRDTDGFVRVRGPERLKSRVERLVLGREHHRSMRSLQRNPIRVARPKGNVFWQSAAFFNVSGRLSTCPRSIIQSLCWRSARRLAADWLKVVITGFALSAITRAMGRKDHERKESCLAQRRWGRAQIR
jgi:hypothetical protein